MNQEEIDLLSSIYSAAHESVSLTPSNFLQVKLPPSLKIVLEIPEGYPERRAPILQSLEGTDCSLSKAGMDVIEKVFTPGTPCLYSIIEALKVLYMSSKEKLQASPQERNQDKAFILLELDHMRNEKKYTKALQLWTTELGLLGRLLLFDKRIILLLLGEFSSLKEFISRLRNRNVDIDSRGRPCKERMAKILCSLNYEAQFIVQSSIWNHGSSFQVVKETTLRFRDFLSQHNLCELYDKYMI